MEAWDELVGGSSGIGALKRRLGRLLAEGSALSRLLIRGEAGSGKGLLARLIHLGGPRSSGPFVHIHGAGLPAGATAAELFAPADGGTVYLEELEQLPAELQEAVLALVDRRRGRPRDAGAPDVFVIVADSGTLSSAVRTGRVRADLYQRLAATTLVLPPLRTRGRDVLRLAERFLARAAHDYGMAAKRLDRGARAALLEHDWPGNVRELANVIERAALFTDGPVVTAAALGLALVPGGAAMGRGGRGTAPGGLSRDEAVRAQLEAALVRTGWNISRAAALLGMARNTVYANIQKFALRAEPRGRGAARRPAVERPAAAGDRRVRWERRALTLLYVEIERPAEASTGPAGAALEIALDKLERFGGMLQAITPTSALAAFGLDGVEDAPRRAAHAALAVGKAIRVARAEGRGVAGAAVAVHVARMLVGRQGSRALIDADAARSERPVLEALVRGVGLGEVVASAPAAVLLRRRFELEPLAGGTAQRLLGLEREGIDLWGPHTPFVGRRGELAALAARLEHARAGAGGLVTIVGEAGVGKSRLMWELERHERAAGCHVVEMRCVPFARAAAEHPVAALLRAHFAVDRRAPGAEARARVVEGVRALDESLEAAVPGLCSWLEVSIEDAGWQVLEPAERRRAAIDAVTRLLVAQSAARPVLLIVDDVQWADSETEGVLAQLAAPPPGTRLLVVASRRGEIPPASDLSADARLALGPLPPPDAEGMLRRLVGDDPSLPAAMRLVTEAADGNPLFLEESVRALVETGALAGERGRYRAARPVGALRVPATVEQLLAGRIARLQPGDRALLQCAAAIGREVFVEVLAAAADEPVSRLAEPIERLVAADFLREARSAEGVAWEFKHPLTRETAYASLAEHERPALHRRILAALEARGERAATDETERLAHHAFRGGVWDKAVNYLRQAGERAFRRWANPEAEEWLAQALVALERWPEGRAKTEMAIDIRLSLRDPLWVLGKMDELRARLEEALELAEALGDGGRLGWTCCHLARLDWAAAEHARALASGERALAIATERGDSALAIETRFYVAAVRLAMGEAGPAAAMLRQNLAALEGGTARLPRRFRLQGPLLHRGYLSRCLAELGEYPEAVTCVEAAVGMADRIGNPFSRVTARFGLGNALLRGDRPAEAIPPLEAGVALCREFMLENWRPAVMATLGAAYVATDRVDAGRRLIEEAVAQSEADRILSSHTMWVVYLGEARLREGRHAEARAEALRAASLARARGERGFEAWATRLLGRIAADIGDRDGAAAAYARTLEAARAMGMRPLAERCRAEMARAAGGRP